MSPDANNTVYLTDHSLSRHRELLPQALPNASDTKLFDRLMAEAKSNGLTWMEGLEYVIQRRRALLN